MPAYSFKERFVPFVKDGSKPHTVRSRRKRPSRIGDRVALYYGLRTKWCNKLSEENCLRAVSILVMAEGTVYLFSDMVKDPGHVARVTKYKLPAIQAESIDGNVILGEMQTPARMNRFAWLDGFRPNGSTLENPGEAWNLMFRYWSANNVLPWCGDVIYWNLQYEL